MIISDSVIIGNAVDDTKVDFRRGWFIGQFIPSESGLKHTSEIEVKWGIHSANDERTSEGVNAEATSLSILISGLFILDFPHLQQTIQLRRTGDYAIWAPGVSHTWKALENSTILTVRWPSTEVI